MDIGDVCSRHSALEVAMEVIYNDHVAEEALMVSEWSRRDGTAGYDSRNRHLCSSAR